ncbi:COG5437 Predicted secreted protein [uncultured Caudovirales phage]|uniref:COG5437 Predicted secreted protein n=1 Tax=uncultured Caudovirales phage TaxID=2100421 RepID=A0A6J7WRG2_9CAUD|nr:COG5437 Predicted secreted protein [uncultured Caudovirales phage]
MATSGVFNGTLLVVKLAGVAVAHAKTCALSVGVNMADATTKDSGGWNEHIQGVRNWSVKTDGLAVIQSADAGVNVEDLFSSISSRTDVSLTFSTFVSGDKIWTGTASVESMDFTGDMESPATFSASFTGTGALVMTTVA